MIRCDGFGKLLKQGFFTLLISCFILLGGSFVDSSFVVHNNADYYTSTLDSNIELNVFNKGQLGSQRFGQTKRMLAFSSKRDSQGKNSRIYFFWGDNQKPYYFVQMYGYFYQGFLKKYMICDELTGGFAGTINNLHCSNHDITDNFATEVGGLFDSMTRTDIWGYDIHTRNCYGDTYLVNQVCFSSSTYHNSVCFSAGGGDPYSTLCSCSDCNNANGGTYIFSGQDFTSVPDYILNTPPGFSISNESNGSNEISNDNNYITGDYLYSTCTYGEIIDYLNQGDRSPYFCYGGLDNFDLYNPEINYNPIPGTGKTLNQIWSNAHGTRDTPFEWYSFRNGLYGDSKYDAMWSSYPAVYHTWFDLFKQYGGGWQGFDNVLEYCNIVLSLDSLSGSVYRGKNDTFNRSCNYIIENKNNILLGGSGGIVNGINRGSGVKPQTNAVQFIQNFFNKAQEVIPTNYQDIGGFGFLPVYIITFLCALIFFRFIFH